MIYKHQSAKLLGLSPVVAVVFGCMAAREARSQAVNLDTIGISSGFETPDADPNNDAAEQTIARTLSPGWTFNLLGGASGDYGTADEDATFYGSNPLPAPFQGRQIGYFNLEAFSAGEVISDSIGTLTAGQTYTLNVAVGARFRTQNDWSNIRYTVGLRTLSGTNLGTFATVDLDPGSGPTVISDLAYTLNVNAEAAGFVGNDARIVIRGINLGTGVTPPGFTQANFDNVRLNGTLGAPNRPILTIDQATGAVSLSKTGTTNMAITGYSLTSSVGALNSTAWLSIADHYDKPSAPTPGNGSVDSNDAWTVLSAAGSKTNLAEGEANIGGNGGTLSNSSINLGTAWRKSPYQDIQATITFADGTVAPLDIVYSGTAISAADLNTDGAVNGADWTLFKANWATSLNGLTKVEAFYDGDLNGDLKHDLSDFLLFKTAYNGGNGAGSFDAMLAQVPEPAAAMLFIIAGVLGITRIRTRNYHQGILPMICSLPARFVLLAILAAALLPAGSARAQSVVAHWSFDTPTLTTSAGNITGISDQTANHNMSVGATTGSGGGCPCNSNAIPTTNSITGQFGQGLSLTGNNTVALGGGQFLTYPNLNDLTTVLSAPGAPSYTISYWLNTTTTNAQQYTILGDWGNAASNPGRFTYGYGISFTGTTAQMRGQSRFNTTTAGNGTDIFARADNAAALNNGSWHMLTWTFNTATGQLTSYLDATQVTQTTSAATNFNMVRSSSTVGTLGLKGDSGNFINGSYSIDEAWVINGALSQAGVTQLFNSNSVSPTNLTLRVDPATGQAQLRNNTAGAIDLNSYRITSGAGALAPSTWTPISSQSISGFPAGNGSGNGWETPPSSANPADYNGNGTVDAADYVKWRKDNINGSAGYDAFRNAFGMTGGGGPGTANDLVEWYLQGSSTFATGVSINLGQAFTVGGAHDLSFTYGTANGVVSGTVEYGSLGAGSSVSAVPEPTTGLLLLSAVGAICCSRRRQALRLNVPVVRFGLLIALFAALCAAQRSVSAAYTVDRLYHFGDDPLENASAGIEVGSGATNVDPGTTLDSQGPSGAFIDLAVNGATGKPKYLDVSVASADIASPRPGASSGNLGALFDGVDDYLNGLRLNQPNNAPGTLLYTTPGPLNYDGILTRGFQAWIYPKSAGSTVAQHVVMDSRQHGVQTTTGGTWALVYGNTTVNSNSAINFNQWSHVEVAMPGTLPNREVLYVNGVAIAARQANYTTNGDPVGGENAYALTVAAATGNTVPTVGTTNRFNGVVDELQMFVWGSTFDASTNTVTNLGQFNYATDNQYAASHLTGVAGDVNQSGSLTQADIDAFVANWLAEKLVNNIRVGDMTTILKGDLNFDGVTDLSDLAILHSAVAGAGSGASFDLTALNSLVPEPAPISLLVTCLSGLGVYRRRRA